LRFDRTVPLAAYVARHKNDLVFPFPRYVIGSVWRGERAKAGRYRQFVQADIDVVGRGFRQTWNKNEDFDTAL
jgi:histidyl-tRNA synthetase